MMDWNHIAIALIAATPPTLLALATLVSSWRNSEKIDHNTFLTKEGAVQAVTNAKVAAKAAHSAEDKVEELKKSLNGELEKKIEEIVLRVVSGLKETMSNHIQAYEDNAKEIKESLDKLHGKGK